MVPFKLVAVVVLPSIPYTATEILLPADASALNCTLCVVTLSFVQDAKANTPNAATAAIIIIFLLFIVLVCNE
ncbi:hypothetical protein D3C80_1847970 [compost metagenome]